MASSFLRKFILVISRYFLPFLYVFLPLFTIAKERAVTPAKALEQAMYFDACDYTRLFYGANYCVFQPTLYNPFECLIMPGEYIYQSLLKDLYMQRNNERKWDRSKDKVPVFDSFEMLADYGALSKHSSLFQYNEVADSLMVRNKRRYKYFYGLGNGGVTEIRQTEALYSRKRPDSMVYDGYGTLRILCFYAGDQHLKGALIQHCQTPFNDSMAAFDYSKISVRNDNPASQLTFKLQQDTVSIACFPLVPALFTDSLDHVYSKLVNSDFDWVVDGFDYAHYLRRWQQLLYDATNNQKAAASAARNPYCMQMYYDEQKSEYHVAYYYFDVKTKDIVYDDQLNRLRTVTVFDNTIRVDERSDIREFNVSARFTGGIGIKYDSYIGELPVSLTLMNYRAKDISGTNPSNTHHMLQCGLIVHDDPVPFAEHHAIADSFTFEKLMASVKLKPDEQTSLKLAYQKMKGYDTLLERTVYNGVLVGCEVINTPGFSVQALNRPVQEMLLAIPGNGGATNLLINKGYRNLERHYGPMVPSFDMARPTKCTRTTTAFSVRPFIHNDTL